MKHKYRTKSRKIPSSNSRKQKKREETRKNQINRTKTKWLSIKRPIFKKRETVYINSPPVTNGCCMCGNKIQENIRLNPVLCLQKYADNAHRICLDCWYRPGGFGEEGTRHPCPGCKNNFPYWKTKKVELNNNIENFIDLS